MCIRDRNNGTWKNTYENSYGIKHQYVSESFADCGEWTPDSGTMPGGAVMQYNKRESSKLFLETDKKLNRRMLRFTFDRTSESSGASLTIKTPVMDNVRIKQAVLEFEIKVDSGVSNNAGNILFFGLSNAAPVSYTHLEEKIYIARPKEIMDNGNYYDIVNVTCSDRQNDVNVETNVTDMDYNTRWSCETQGSYVTLELAEVSPVAYIGIAMYSLSLIHI